VCHESDLSIGAVHGGPAHWEMPLMSRSARPGTSRRTCALRSLGTGSPRPCSPRRPKRAGREVDERFRWATSRRSAKRRSWSASVSRAPRAGAWGSHSGLASHEPRHERERHLLDAAPAVVGGERIAATGDLLDLRCFRCGAPPEPDPRREGRPPGSGRMVSSLGLFRPGRRFARDRRRRGWRPCRAAERER
jgi:hypothetical protein